MVYRRIVFNTKGFSLKVQYFVEEYNRARKHSFIHLLDGRCLKAYLPLYNRFVHGVDFEPIHVFTDDELHCAFHTKSFSAKMRLPKEQLQKLCQMRGLPPGNRKEDMVRVLENFHLREILRTMNVSFFDEDDMEVERNNNDHDDDEEEEQEEEQDEESEGQEEKESHGRIYKKRKLKK
jgi:hypothetical protein